MVANNKNQHFVPKAYLRRFSCDPPDAERRRINGYLIDHEKFIDGISISDQCSKNKFYGSDEIFEDFVQHFEGCYGIAIEALEGNGQIYAGDIARFFLLQYLRTPHMLEQRRKTIDHAQNLKVGGISRPEPMNFVQSREMQHQLYIAAAENDILEDLEPVFIVNLTSVPFITSDNPATCTNRYNIQKLGDPTSGLVSSGLVAAMPLNSHWLYLAYDRDVYKLNANDGILELRNENDVHRLNELQAIMATSCLYFADETGKAAVERAMQHGMEKRRDSWVEIWTGIADGVVKGMERYRKEQPGDEESREPRIVSVSPIMPKPHTWPSFLKLSASPKGCDTGAMAGFFRQGSQQAKDGKLPLIKLPKAQHRDANPLTRKVAYIKE